MGLDIGTDPFAHFRVRHGNDGHQGNIRMAANQFLNLGGTNALPSPIDHFLEPTGQCNITRNIDLGHISGSKETIAAKYPGVFLRGLKISAKNTRPFDEQFSGNIHRQFFAISVNHFINIVRAGGFSDGMQNCFRNIRRSGQAGLAFGTTVPVEKRTNELFPHPFN